MTLLNEADVRRRARSVTTRLQKSAASVLSESKAPESETFDVFLSHASAESDELLLGVKAILEDIGLSVYVDKYTDTMLSPENVTPKTAETLRNRMRRSSALLYLYSSHSTTSKWMPWELGFFDGLNGRVGVIPVTQAQEKAFQGQEYLSLYPYVNFITLNGNSEPTFFIDRAFLEYAHLIPWIRGRQQIRKQY